MKNTNKTTNTALIVDLTTVKSPADVTDAFILAKVNAGIPITNTELVTFKLNTVDRIIDYINYLTSEFDSNVTYIEDDELAKTLLNEINKALNKKKAPWYKRFWNWVKKPFSRKK